MAVEDVGHLERCGEHCQIGLQPLDPRHDRERRLVRRDLHGRARQQSGREEPEVAHSTHRLVRPVIDQVTEPDADRGKIQDRVEEGRGDRSPPGPLVREQVVLVCPQRWRQAPRRWRVATAEGNCGKKLNRRGSGLSGARRRPRALPA